MKIYHYTVPMLILLAFSQAGQAQKDVLSVKKHLSRVDTFPAQFQNKLQTTIQHQADKLASQLSFKDQFSFLNNLYKNPIVFSGAQAEYTTVNANSGTSANNTSYYGDAFITSSWSIAGVPLELTINNQTWNDITNNNFSNASIRFDRGVYLEQLKKKLKGKFNPQTLANDILPDPVDMIKNNAEAFLKHDLEAINKTFGDGLKDKMQQLGDLKGIFTKDMTAVRQQLMNNEYVRSITEKEKLLTELINKKNSGQWVNKEELQSLESEVSKLKGVTALIAKIEEHKSKWQSSGLLNKIKQADVLNKQRLEQLARDPGAITRLAKEHFNLSGFQRLFLKINKLNLGQNTLSASNLSVQHLLNKGINTEFLNNNRYLLAGIGKIKSLNSIIDQQFTDNLTAGNGMAKMVSIGLGSQAASHSRIALMSYDQSMDYLPGVAAMNTLRSSLVTTISNEINIGSKGILTTEISRSATSYSNVAASDTSLSKKSSLQRVVDLDDFWKNMAFSVKYDDEWEKQALSYGVHIGKTANGYTNPGNTLLNNGAKELGFNIKKAFWKRKLQASLRSDIREYNYGDDNSKVWRNFYTVVDVKWRLKQGQSIGVRYMPNKMIRLDNGKKSTVTLVERLSIDGNLSKKIFGTYYRNNLSLSRQKNSFLLNDQLVSNTSFTLASFQNIVVRQKLLYLNVNYDYAHNASSYIYLNSSFMADAGTAFSLFKTLSLSSAISYNSVQGWYRQVGIKQTISNQLSERFNLNIYVDVRKNLALYQPLLYGLFRADVSIHYIIKR